MGRHQRVYGPLRAPKEAPTACACGCGNPPTDGKWVKGHWNKGSHRGAGNELCLCGCGEQSVTPWKTGHQKPHYERMRAEKKAQEKPSLIGEPCLCGCELLANRANGWYAGHWNRGKKKPPRTLEHRANLGAAHIGKGQMFGAANPMFGKPSPHRNPDREAQLFKVKVAKMWRHTLGRIRKRFYTTGSGRTLDVLGYSADDLRHHLESLFEPGMSWANHGVGPGRWNIDHIRPICTFPVTTHAGVVNELTNLRPLWFEENMARTRQTWKAQ